LAASFPLAVPGASSVLNDLPVSFIERSFKKDSKIYIEGQLETRKYTHMRIPMVMRTVSNMFVRTIPA
jgi:hypothetical protein